MFVMPAEKFLEISEHVEQMVNEMGFPELATPDFDISSIQHPESKIEATGNSISEELTPILEDFLEDYASYLKKTRDGRMEKAKSLLDSDFLESYMHMPEQDIKLVKLPFHFITTFLEAPIRFQPYGFHTDIFYRNKKIPAGYLRERLSGSLFEQFSGIYFSAAAGLARVIEMQSFLEKKVNASKKFMIEEIRGKSSSEYDSQERIKDLEQALTLYEQEESRQVNYQKSLVISDLGMLDSAYRKLRMDNLTLREHFEEELEIMAKTITPKQP